MSLSTRCAKRIGILFCVALLLTFSFSPKQAFAVASFSRMYKMSCLACHTNTPRINYFGEKLLARGYEMDRMTQADQPAGHVKTEASCTSCHNSGKPSDAVGGEKFSPNLFLDKVSNYLSLRLKFTPLKLTTNAMTQEGKKETKITVGNSNWIQFWVAGPIAKNIALRAEAELSNGGSVGLHNYAVAFSNIIPDGLLNLRVGGFTHGEWLSVSDQKRFFAPHFNIYNVKSAAGKGEDTFKVAGAEPAIEAYGYAGPVVYQLGVSSGKKAGDVNKYKNYWGTARLYLATSGKLAGTNISASYVSGVDTTEHATIKYKVTTIDGENIEIPKTITIPIQKDNFHRYIVSAILRYAPLEIMGSYVVGRDGNWDLSTGIDNEFSGGFVQAILSVTKKLDLGAIYQNTTSDDPSIKYNHCLVGGNYYMRENMMISTYYDFDLLGESKTHPDKQSTLAVNFRAMF